MKNITQQETSSFIIVSINIVMTEKHEVTRVLGKYLRWVNKELIQTLWESRNILIRIFIPSHLLRVPDKI